MDDLDFDHLLEGEDGPTSERSAVDLQFHYENREHEISMDFEMHQQEFDVDIEGEDDAPMANAEELDKMERTLQSMEALPSQNVAQQNGDEDECELLDWPEISDVPMFLALNEAYSETISAMIFKVERAIRENKEKQKELDLREQKYASSKLLTRKKVPVLQYLPPYFKDDHMMCPPLSEEARLKLSTLTYDPLQKEEKKWTVSDLKKLREAVKQAIICNKLRDITQRKEILIEKIHASGQETSKSELLQWREEIELCDRKIKHEYSKSEDEILVGDYSNIDWQTIACKNFLNTRDANSIRLKWINEQCPRWNTSSWTKAEFEKLKEIVEGSAFVSWSVVGDRLGTRRSPWMCFEKYQSEMAEKASYREWTPDEDNKLLSMVSIFTKNGVIFWDRVAHQMAGRQKYQVKSRYERTLCQTINRGRWTDEEDLLLMSAVARLGPKDWSNVAKSVAGRSDNQCRDRWLSVLDKRSVANVWSLEEDEKLVYAVSILGRGRWLECSQLVGKNRTANQCRSRFLSLISTKIKSCTTNFNMKSMMNKWDAIAAKKRDRVRRIYEVFSEAKTVDDKTLDNFMTSENNTDSSPTKSRKSVWDSFDPEQREMVQRDIEAISKKYENGGNTTEEGAEALLQQLPLDIYADLPNLLKHCQAVSTMFGLPPPVSKPRPSLPEPARKKIKKGVSAPRKVYMNQMLEAQPVPEVTTFSEDVPEEERVISVSNALCHLVRKHEQHEWNQECRKKYAEPGVKLAGLAVRDGLAKYLPTALDCVKKDEPLPTDCYLSPNYVTCETMERFSKSRVYLNRQAATHFYKSSVDATGVLFEPQPSMATAAYKASDRLFVKLTKDVTESDPYLQLKARMRMLFTEPARLMVAEGDPHKYLQEKGTLRDQIKHLEDQNEQLNQNANEQLEKGKTLELGDAKELLRLRFEDGLLEDAAEKEREKREAAEKQTQKRKKAAARRAEKKREEGDAEESEEIADEEEMEGDLDPMELSIRRVISRSKEVGQPKKKKGRGKSAAKKAKLTEDNVGDTFDEVVESVSRAPAGEDLLKPVGDQNPTGLGQTDKELFKTEAPDE